MELAPAEKGLSGLMSRRSAMGTFAGWMHGHRSRARGIPVPIHRVNEMYAQIPPEIAGITGGKGDIGLRVSLNAGTVSAGGVRSLIATRARAEIDVRLPPGVSGAEIEKHVKSEGEGDVAISIKDIKAWDANGLNYRIHSCASSRMLRRRYEESGRNSWCGTGQRARRWRNLGIPSACYGPSRPCRQAWTITPMSRTSWIAPKSMHALASG